MSSDFDDGDDEIISIRNLIIRLCTTPSSDVNFLNPLGHTHRNILLDLRNSGGDEKRWDTFVDVGNATISLPPIIVQTHPLSDEKAKESYWSYLTSERTRHLFAGGLAGAFSRMLVHPLDRVRTIMLLNPNDAKFETMSKTLRTFVRELGWIVGLFRGLDASLVRIIPEVAIKFAVYEELKKRLIVEQAGHQQRAWITFIDRFAAGAAAGITSHCFSYPFKVVQVRLANQRPFGSEFRGITDCFRKLYASTGFFGFYRGFGTSVTALGPSIGLDFAVYGFLKTLYKNHYQKQGQLPPAYVLLGCGTVASTVAHTATYPLILPQTRMQAGDKRALRIQSGEKSVFGYLRESYKEQGFRKGLYLGLLPSLIKVVPSVSLSFLFYENILRIILPPKPGETAEDEDSGEI